MVRDVFGFCLASLPKLRDPHVWSTALCDNPPFLGKLRAPIAACTSKGAACLLTRSPLRFRPVQIVHMRSEASSRAKV